MNYKNFTFLSILFLLLGIGVNLKAQSPASGDYVFTGAKDTIWTNSGNWSISDGAGNLTATTAIPTQANNVWIPAGKRIGNQVTTSSTISSIGSGVTQLTLPAKNSKIFLGMTASGTGIALGTYVTAISSDSITITLSTPTTTAGTSVSVSFWPSCKDLNISGYYAQNSQTCCYGNLNVYQGGILYTTTTGGIYCGNISNYGTIKASTTYSSLKVIYVGFSGTLPLSGDYTIVNDGVFGATAPTTAPSATNYPGSGIKVLFSESCKNLTIRPSSSTVTGYAFNIGAIMPNYSASSPASTQDCNLNINETMSLLYNGGFCLTLQQSNVTTGTTRTCTIAPGVTVYAGGRFHANANVTTASQGNFIYNIYGTLDFSSYIYGSAANPTDFDLMLTTASGNTGSLTVNVGNGTDPASLIIGKSIKMCKQPAQAINFNCNTNSTVTFAYSTKKNNNGANVFQLQSYNATTGCYNPAVYLFPSKFYNLTINNDSTVLPVTAQYSGAFNKTTNAYNITTWSATTTYSAPAANTTMAPGAVVNTGTNLYYVPVVSNVATYASGASSLTVANDTITKYICSGQYISGSGIPSAATVSATYTQGATTVPISSPVSTTGTGTNTTVNFIKGTSSATAPTATVAGGIYAATYSPVLDGSQYLIYLGPVTLPTLGVNSESGSTLKVYSIDKQVIISGATPGDKISIYSISGARQASAIASSNATTVVLPSGIYIVKAGSKVSKVLVK